MNTGRQLVLGTSQPRWLISLVVIGVFLLCAYGRKFVLGQLGITQVDDLWQLFFVVYSWYWLPPFLVALWLVGWRNAAMALGLKANFLLALGIGFVCTLPMLFGYAVLGDFTPATRPELMLLQGAVFPGLMEEILYRGLLFGLLFRFARWGFLPAALIGALVFGAAHLSQGDTLASASGAFFVTALGAIWFAWMYVEWRNNLWVPISFHILMNLYWDLFDMGEIATGGMTANVFRIATIALSIGITLWFVRRAGSRIVRGRSWLRRD